MYSGNNSTHAVGNGRRSISHIDVLILTFLVIEGFFVIAINAFVIFLILRKHFLQTITNLCLGSLALSDMLTGLYVIPLILACNMAPEYSLDVCLAMDLGQRFLAISTILHLLVITIERYHIIVLARTASSSSRLTTRFALGVLATVWGFSLTISLVQISWTHEEEGSKAKMDVVYDLICLCVLVFLPLIIMVFAYVNIIFALKKQLQKIKGCLSHISRKSKERHNRKERKAVIIYGMMIVVYVVGWFNYFVQTLQEDIAPSSSQIPYWANIILLYLKFSTGFLNPILYTFFKQDFKNARRSLRVCNKGGDEVNEGRSSSYYPTELSTFYIKSSGVNY